MVYTVTKNVNRPFKVRQCDPASRICDPAKAKGGLAEQIPLINEEFRDVTTNMMDRENEQALPWNDDNNLKKELFWPGYTSEAECAGKLTQFITPEEDRASVTEQVDGAGNIIRILFATTSRVPHAFMRFVLPAREHHVFARMTVANPYNPEEGRYLSKEDVFVAGGPLTFFPTPHVRRSRQAVRRKCSLCFWMNARTISSNYCQHAICLTCLGQTSLISVDNYVCPKCWVVPEKVTISWDHRAGEQR